MDVKKIGKIPDGGGWKAHGRQMGRTGAQKRAKIECDYVHSLVDDHCRLAYSEILPDEKGPTCAASPLRVAAYFASFGITRIERVMTKTTSVTSCPPTSPKPWRTSTPSTSSSGPTAPGRTARSVKTC